MTLKELAEKIKGHTITVRTFYGVWRVDIDGRTATGSRALSSAIDTDLERAIRAALADLGIE